MSSVIRLAQIVYKLYADRSQLRPAAVHRIGLAQQAGILRLGDEGVRTALNLLAARKSDLLEHAPPASEIERPYPLTKYLPSILGEELSRLFPPPVLQLMLIDTDHGLSCSQMPVTKPNLGKIERARQRVIEASKFYGYRGFSEEIDRHYDPSSAYFIVENRHGEIVAAARMTRKTVNIRMPMEDGFKADGTHYSLTGKEELVAEINSFFYLRRQPREMRQVVLEILFASLGRYAWLMGFEQVFCLADAGNQKTQGLYLKAGFKISDRFKDKISFSSFGSNKDENFEPTQWTILVMSRAMAIWHALRGINYLSI